MIFKELKIHGVYVIEPEPFRDNRGVFWRHFCEKDFASNGIDLNVVQANVSISRHAYTLRGFHYQVGGHAEGKIVSCLKGSIHDVVVDLREASPTYMQWVGCDLSEANQRSIYIAPGCASAFLTLEEQSLVQYYASTAYHPESERGIRYNDPAFGFEWPHDPMHISDKDAGYLDFLSKVVS